MIKRKGKRAGRMKCLKDKQKDRCMKKVSFFESRDYQTMRKKEITR